MNGQFSLLSSGFFPSSAGSSTLLNAAAVGSAPYAGFFGSFSSQNPMSNPFYPAYNSFNVLNMTPGNLTGSVLAFPPQPTSFIGIQRTNPVASFFCGMRGKPESPSLPSSSSTTRQEEQPNCLPTSSPCSTASLAQVKSSDNAEKSCERVVPPLTRDSRLSDANENDSLGLSRAEKALDNPSEAVNGSKEQEEVIVIEDEEPEEPRRFTVFPPLNNNNVRRKGLEDTISPSPSSSSSSSSFPAAAVGTDHEREKKGRDATRRESLGGFKFHDLSSQLLDDESEEETNDHEEGGCEWTVVRKKPKVVSSIRKSSTGTISPERLREVLRNNSRVALKASPKFIVNLEYEGLDLFLQPLLNKQHPALDLKINAKPSEEVIEEMYQKYQDIYSPLMDKVIEPFLKQTFDSIDSAVCTLSMVIRSYVSGFSVHRRRCGKCSDGTRVITLQCHTLNNMKEKTGDVIEATSDPTLPKRSSNNGKECPWRAIVVFREGKARFSRCDSFAVHGRECLCCFSRMTPCEVSFQESLSRHNRAGVMDFLAQRVVRTGTLCQRKFRRSSAGEAWIDDDFMKSSLSKEIDKDISNLESFEVVPDTELGRILRFLSLLKEKEHFDIEVKLEKCAKQVELVSIYVMWPEGKKLLESLSDAVYCDSMWNVSCNSYFALTIVVVDENYKLALTTLCLTKKEKKMAWEDFFRWVKGRVPAFNPKCLLTDGAEYIDTSFDAVMGSSHRHIVCWWHQQENMKAKCGCNQTLRKKLLRMTYIPNEQLLDRAKQDAENYATIHRLWNVRDSIQKAYDNALIKLNVFTGGTVTNSYAESINRLLRDGGLTSSFPLLNILRSLFNFVLQHRHPTVWPFTPSEALKSIVSDTVLKTVSNGALKKLEGALRTALKDCSILEQTPDSATVNQVITCRKDRNTSYQKTEKYYVKWTDGIPKCSCNRVVFGGIPCPHIVIHALQVSRLVPIDCFNPRFYVTIPPVPNDSQDQEDVPFPPSSPSPSSSSSDFFEVEIGPELISDDDEANAEANSTFVDLVEAVQQPNHSSPGDSLQHVPLKSILPLVLRSPEEIILYQRLQAKADSLVTIRAVSEYENEANEVLLRLRAQVEGLAPTYDVLTSMNSALPSTGRRVVIDAEGDDLESIAPLRIIPSPETKGICDTLHIEDASMNSRFPGSDWSLFRGRLLAIIIRLLLANRVCNQLVQGFIRLYEQLIDNLVDKCASSPSNPSASVSPVHGRLTTNSYKTVPRAVARYCVDELLDASASGTLFILSADSNQSSSAPVVLSDSDDSSQPLPLSASDFYLVDSTDRSMHSTFDSSGIVFNQAESRVKAVVRNRTEVMSSSHSTWQPAAKRHNI